MFFSATIARIASPISVAMWCILPSVIELCFLNLIKLDRFSFQLFLRIINEYIAEGQRRFFRGFDDPAEPSLYDRGINPYALTDIQGKFINVFKITLQARG